MHKPSHHLHRPLKQLGIALAISLLLNGLLVGELLYLLFPWPTAVEVASTKKHKATPLALDYSLEDLYSLLRLLPARQLVDLLQDGRWVEEGWTLRDLALGLLVEDHFLDLERALPTPDRPVERRVQLQGLSRPLRLFGGLRQEQFHTIAAFAKGERWPLTLEGFWHQLKEGSATDRPSLLEALSLQPGFGAIYSLLCCDGQQVEREQAAQLIQEGPCTTFLHFSKLATQEATPALRQRLLVAYLEERSHQAASLLLTLEPHFVQKKIDDDHAFLLLELLDNSWPSALPFALQMASSQRSDELCQAATLLISSWGKGDLLAAKALPSAEELAAATRPQPPPSLEQAASQPSAFRHCVVRGDSLWKIAKQYRVALKELAAWNELPIDKPLYPGMELWIRSPSEVK